MRQIFLKLKNIFISCAENNYRPKFLDSKILSYYIIVLMILKLTIVPFYLFFQESNFFADISRNLLIQLTNKEREDLKIPPLKENTLLDQAAYLKAQDMINNDYFSHQSPQGLSPWYWFKEAGYYYRFAGENLAIGFLDSEEVFKGWLGSPSHKDNILNPNYKDIGIAVLKGNFAGNDTTVVVQLLGTVQSVVKEEEKIETKTEIENKEIETSPEVKKEVLPAQSVQENQEKTIAPIQEKNSKDIVIMNFLYFMTSKYYNLIQTIIYASLILIIFMLLVNVILTPKKLIKNLIFKTTFSIFLLLFFTVIDKVLVLRLIPHNFKIY
jgi:hypothetical protein